MLTAIIDYESGNLHSAEKAFQRMAREMDAGEVVVTSDADVVARADRLVLPGDGAFPACAAELRGHKGIYDAMVHAVEDKGRPFLGICVGMQLMATTGHEYEDTPGLDWVGGDVVKITPEDPALKVPHMGWNDLVIDHDHPVFAGISSGDHCYFVHSYHFRVADPAERLAHVDYGGDVTAVIGKGTMLGMQFHPEKSQHVGLRMIGNFLTWAP
ncbi:MULTISPECIES: imidazole glycerol phosphate synthase subunit HisH [Rhodobacterales]|jgi:glutamine amidotransferase|uniref:Imidazole glycerol phosphate synthase subunit HisH n=1 Tax=Phaeobacter gallaeciensis TaxID=60890 RepID=A0A1B0ZW20_9RHOB|nr:MULTISPECIES: imidazole glycerol phosphate synthase subunit HisH [Phaeobacter]MDF1771731.1 imidazole glycerol phosphate synthase subunit HisH [Pseudophaeobacter sp. bin_em_oilr2.035]ANP38359.1 imidazole glycerol phosphate synthase subunit HisH [Phaeobacter gallaeciensis]MDE4061330.1 imidazole glycerol phosphate synthase subunit HisH [Phaeobacter gallaeciensis]MDE4124475.1 imidazole glycerol phosphate synthase subunit HisH [Phaeobacter gallaeciensis]MDE4128794.1 imidazole glycerol phosphate 